MNKIIETENSVLYYWFDPHFGTKREEGISKSKLETQEVLLKIQESFPEARVEHEASGAPIILNCRYSTISISHYGGYFSVYLSNEPVGVDIQSFKTSLEKGKHFYVNSEDEENELTKQNLHLIWSAKEAFYKKLKGEIPSLRNEVIITDINHTINKIKLLHKDKSEVLNFKVHKTFVLVWT